MGNFNKLHRFFVVLLWPFSLIYRFGFALYQTLHRWGILSVKQFATAVVSVGNITMGGTGKTPFVIFLTQLFREMQKTTAVVSRGYGRNSEAGVIDLERQKQADSGDEPWLISIKTMAPVIVADKKRVACEYAIKAYEPDILILDDGFQSFSIRRDLDIVLIDTTDAFLTSFLIPAGVLRENLVAVRRADAIILTRCDQAGGEGVRALTRRIRNVSSTIPLFRSSHEVLGLVSSPGTEVMDPLTLKGKRIVSVSAIANNKSFLRSLSGLGLNVVFDRSYLDHHRYTAGDIADISHAVAEHSADAVVTTEKDLYGLRSFTASIPVPLFALSIRITLHDRERFVKFCRRKGIL